jgi:hypothetical protein
VEHLAIFVDPFRLKVHEFISLTLFLFVRNYEGETFTAEWGGQKSANICERAKIRHPDNFSLPLF